MITDPYQVLGVTEQISDADLKKTYRELSKKWHPDANPGNPEMAEERFKEIQEAYRQIVDARARGTSAYGPAPSSYQKTETGGSAAGYGGTGGYANANAYEGFEEFFRQWSRYSEERREEESASMEAARNLINSGRYAEAMELLRKTEPSMRTARWYFYAAHAEQGAGNNYNALNFIKRACDLDPGNPQYQQYLSYLQRGGIWYENRGETYQRSGSGSSGSWCLSMIALNIFCNLCFPGSGFCI